ncbi:MAG: response regulator [Bacteroidales bacterium]|nr:response regulator [Bacteroidales bacterium]MBS3773635.1 response regulator [Bacteroidales bacterium]
MTEASKILIIDDMPSHLLLLKTILEEEGFEIITAEDGENALRTLKEDEAIALILLDIMMPGFDGFDFLDKINESETYETPVIIVSAKTDNTSIQKAIEKGAYDYLTKPFNVQDIRNKVRSALK